MLFCGFWLFPGCVQTKQDSKIALFQWLVTALSSKYFSFGSPASGKITLNASSAPDGKTSLFRSTSYGMVEHQFQERTVSFICLVLDLPSVPVWYWLTSNKFYQPQTQMLLMPLSWPAGRSSDFQGLGPPWRISRNCAWQGLKLTFFV